MEIKIIITITDEDIVRDYKDIHPDLIADDFRNNTNAWIKDASIEAEVQD